jgi:membrane associated rhomboid family serine protease
MLSSERVIMSLTTLIKLWNCVLFQSRFSFLIDCFSSVLLLTIPDISLSQYLTLSSCEFKHQNIELFNEL